MLATLLSIAAGLLLFVTLRHRRTAKTDARRMEALQTEVEALRQAAAARESELTELKSRAGALARFASIGRMASAVVHEINTPLAVIRLSTDMLGRQLSNGPTGSDPKIAGRVDLLQQGSAQISAILNWVSELSRDPVDRVVSDINLAEFMKASLPQMTRQQQFPVNLSVDLESS